MKKYYTIAFATAAIPIDLFCMVIRFVPAFPNYFVMQRVHPSWQQALEDAQTQTQVLNLWPQQGDTKYRTSHLTAQEYVYLSQVFPKVQILYAPSALFCADKNVFQFKQLREVHLLPSKRQAQYYTHYKDQKVRRYWYGYNFKRVLFHYATCVGCVVSNDLLKKVLNSDDDEYNRLAVREGVVIGAHCFAETNDMEQGLLEWMRHAHGTYHNIQVTHN